MVLGLGGIGAALFFYFKKKGEEVASGDLLAPEMGAPPSAANTVDPVFNAQVLATHKNRLSAAVKEAINQGLAQGVPGTENKAAGIIFKAAVWIEKNKANLMKLTGQQLVNTLNFQLALLKGALAKL
jgi:hypothetical protein